MSVFAVRAKTTGASLKSVADAASVTVHDRRDSSVRLVASSGRMMGSKKMRGVGKL